MLISIEESTETIKIALVGKYIKVHDVKLSECVKESLNAVTHLMYDQKDKHFKGGTRG